MHWCCSWWLLYLIRYLDLGISVSFTLLCQIPRSILPSPRFRLRSNLDSPYWDSLQIFSFLKKPSSVSLCFSRLASRILSLPCSTAWVTVRKQSSKSHNHSIQRLHRLLRSLDHWWNMHLHMNLDSFLLGTLLWLSSCQDRYCQLLPQWWYRIFH